MLIFWGANLLFPYVSYLSCIVFFFGGGGVFPIWHPPKPPPGWLLVEGPSWSKFPCWTFSEAQRRQQWKHLHGKDLWPNSGTPWRIHGVGIFNPLIRPYFLWAGGWHWGGALRFPWYCWWFRNPANQLRLVVFPIIYKVSWFPGG